MPEPLFTLDHAGRSYLGVTALSPLSLTIGSGQRLGIVGESGAGKSTLIKLLARLIQPTSGSIQFRGADLSLLRGKDLRQYRENVQMIFQDPKSSLDPRLAVGEIVAEPLITLRLPGDHQQRVADLLSQVGLDRSYLSRYPHQLSGGQRQRVALARALAPQPAVLLADEPVSSLDVTSRAQVLNLLVQRVQSDQLTLVLISHDLSVVRHLCDQVMVLHQGSVVESGPTEQIWTNPQSPYTRELIAARPHLPATADSAADLQARLNATAD